jgi:hypothetical protein
MISIALLVAIAANRFFLQKTITITLFYLMILTKTVIKNEKLLLVFDLHICRQLF